MSKIDKTSPPITQDRLRQLLDYDPSTGIFKWRVNKSAVRKGSVAGAILNTGYVQIQIDSKFYLGHRAAWLYTYGFTPKEIDHKNRIKSDNRIANLRPAGRSYQFHNSNYSIIGKSGYRGVFYRKQLRPWRAKITFNGKENYLGCFTYKEDAAQAYNDAAKSIFGEFAGPLLNVIPPQRKREIPELAVP